MEYHAMSVRLTLPFEFPTPARGPTCIERPLLRPIPATTPASIPTPRRRRAVWLAIHLHGWQLYATLMKLRSDERELLSRKPLAVVEDDRKATLVACNAIA